MKLTDKMRWTICIAAGCILIGVALVAYLLDIPYNPDFMKLLEFAMLMLVCYLLVIYPRTNRSNASTDEVEASEIEEEHDIEE